MTRYSLTRAAAALLGIITTAALAWSASQIASQPIGIASEPLSVASGLAPREIGPLNQATVPHRRNSPRSTSHRAPAVRPAASGPAVAIAPATTGSDSKAAAPSSPAPAPAPPASTPAAAASPQPKTPSASTRAPAPSASVASRGEDRPGDASGSSPGSGSRGSPSAGGHRDD